MEKREEEGKRPDGNFLTNVLLPYATAAVFLGAILWGLLKWLKVF